MANKARGEVGLDADGKRYTLVFNINALCALESQLGEGAPAAGIVAPGSGAISLTRLRAFIWAGLQHHHPKLSLADAGHVIDAVGITNVAASVGEALSAAFPESTTGPFVDRQEPTGGPTS